MFATKLLLKYAVKPCSPPRPFVPPEVAQTIKPLTAVSPALPYTTTSIAKDSVPKTPIAHLHKSRICSRSEPTHASRKKWSQLEQSIVDHPNFEKAAALVQLLNENPTVKPTNPHKIGSLPSGKATLEASPQSKTVQATVNAVKDILKEREKEDEQELEETVEDPPKVEKVETKPPPNVESVELDKPKVEAKPVKKKKPYVINIYLDTKQTKTLEDADIKNKIKEFWYENMLEFEKNQREPTQPKAKEVKPVTSAPILAPSLPEMLPEEVEEVVEEESPPVKQEKSSKKKIASNQQDDLTEVEEEQETLEDVPKYQIEHIKKIYPDVASTTNPHTDRLDGGTPPNYDLTQKIKDVVTAVTPVYTGGFTKYLGMWKKMWAKKQDAKDEKDQAVEENDPQTYSSDNVEDDQAKQAFRIIDNDKVFHMKKKMKFNPYDPQLKKYKDEEEELTKSEAPDVENPSRKLRPKHQRRYYSSTCTEKILPDDSLNCRKRATTHLQITEYQNITEQKMSYSTKANSGKPGSKTPEKEPKTGQARVEDFVDKFKNALAVENKKEFKKIQIVCGPNSQRNSKQHVKVEIVKTDKGGYNNVQKKDGSIKKAHSVKKSK